MTDSGKTMKVTKKQPNSKKCFICGLSNDFGLFTRFYETENGELVAKAYAKDEHQGYPGRLHGGIAGALLDETIGRAIMIESETVWGVTAELNVKLMKPIPVEEELTITGRITKNGGRIFEGEGEIILKDGTVAAKGTGRYFKLPIENIVDTHDEFTGDEWFVEDGPVPDDIVLPS